MALKEIFGDIPITRVIDFMLEHPEHDYTVKEITEYADVAQAVAKRDVQRLVDRGMVVETRKIGGVQLYTLDSTNEITIALIEFDETIKNIMSIETNGCSEPEEKITTEGLIID